MGAQQVPFSITTGVAQRGLMECGRLLWRLHSLKEAVKNENAFKRKCAVEVLRNDVVDSLRSQGKYSRRYAFSRLNQPDIVSSM
ncbi:hypothetical protein HaLaN_16784 [Haematococcus lacustris]|uniref:Uncharacterized protein n=1 Tax=Haematococcus lacustris TaxID=44745 RepID=A0A699ZLT7_HAELA|nr:hypothetical protein HaLaN_16784 [Haematococcus lacustris]